MSRRSRPWSLVTMLSAALMAAMMGWTPAAVAAPVAHQADVAHDRSVAVSALKTAKAATPAMEQFHGQDVRWPSPASGAVDLPAGSTTARPLTVGGLPMQVTPLDSADQTPAGIRAPAADPPGRVRVSVMDRATARAAGGALLLRVVRDDGRRGGAARLTVDYSAFAHAYGADWAWRLQATAVPECALTTPSKAECATQRRLPATNDGSTGTMTIDVSLAAAAGTVVMLAASGSSTESGDFTKTDLKASSTWAAGGNSGDFTWDYPLQMPPVPGNLVPTVDFTYGSGAVDGQTAGSHTQPSELGEGWSYSPGFVERTYRPCFQDSDNSPYWTALNFTSDLCWRLPNAQVMLNGKSSEIVLGDDGTWRLSDDDGEKVELLTGAPNNDLEGEYWKITTQDGTQYWFGAQTLPNGKTGTNSVLTAPVYANHSGEPCFTTSAAASSRCNRQAMRWMLDYVVDRNGNEISYWYGRTANTTALAGDPSFTTAYYREIHLNRIEYGTHTTDASSVQAPARVVFSYADRCLTSSCSTHDETNWPDTPWDLQCDAAPCSNNMSPSFFTDLRLSSVSTQTLANGSYSTVDKWTLTHTFPDPGDASPVLWLQSISRTGYTGTSVTMPPLTFSGIKLQNRADYSASATMQSHNKWRISRVLTETGGQVDITYSNADAHCAYGDTPNPDQNPNRCFPQYYTNPSGQSGWSWWHKRIVTSVVESDTVGGSPPVVTNYAYSTASSSSNVLWAHGDGAAVWGSSGTYRSWSDWRGYSDVTVTKGPATGTRSQMGYVYFRGLHGDKTDTGTRTVTLSPYSGSWSDQEQRAGHLMNEITYDQAGGTPQKIVQYNPWAAVVTGTRTLSSSWADPTTSYSKINRTDNVTTYELSSAGTMTSTTGTVDTFDSIGRLTTRWDKRNVGADDDTCTTYQYADNTTKYLYAFKIREKQFTGACDGDYPDADRLYDHAWRYDGQGYGVAPTLGNISRDYQFDGASWVGNADDVQYDKYGRVTSSADDKGNVTTTDYTDNADHLTTSVTVTNAASQATTTSLDARRGLPLSVTDANSNTTTAAYDGLGRLTSVTRPANTTGTPDTAYAYNVSQTAPSWVQTSTLAANGGKVYTFEIYDGQLRLRQKQTTAPDGKRVITDTQYDGRGLTTKVSTFYNADSGPGSTLVTFSDAAIDRQTRSTYDGRDRQLTSEAWSLGAFKWQTSTSYAPNQVQTVPPAGGTPILDVYDNLGNLTQKRQYQSFADYTDLVAGDFNNDGKTDMFAVRPGSGRRVLFFGVGDGTFTPSMTVSTSAGFDAYRNWVSGRFDSDTNTDAIAIRKSDGALIRYQGNGTGGLPSSNQVGSGFSIYGELAAGDFNGDGYTDLVAIRSSDGMLQYFHAQSGGGAFDNPVDLGTGWTGYEHLVAADANGDGKADLLAIRSSDNMLRRWLGNGNGTFATGTDLFTGWKRANLAAGDFNGDGKADLFGAYPQNQTDPLLKRWSGDGTTFTSMGPLDLDEGQAWDTTSYAYDRRGQLASTTGPDAASWTYVYDLMGRIKQTVDPDTGTSSTAYDTVGNVATTTDGRGQVLASTYDSLNRRTGLYKNGVTAANQLAGWSYDTVAGAKGQLATATRYVGGNQTGGSAYVQAITAYTKNYQPTHVNLTIPAAEGALAGTYGTDYTYKATGQPNTVGLPSAGGLPAETVAYGYSAYGRLTSLTAGSTAIIADQSYTFDDQPYQQLLGAANKQVRHTFTYDAPTGRLAASQLDTQNQTTPTTWDDKATDTYAYDAAGNVRSITGETANVRDRIECFTYDGLRRLADAWTTSSSSCPNKPQRTGVDAYQLNWTFDLAGNRKTETSTNADGTVEYQSTYAYGGTGKPLHSLASVTTTGTGAGTKNYTFDAAGNTTSKPGPGGAQQALTWDEEGRLAKVSDSTDTTMLYGADGNRLIRRDPGGYATLTLPDGTELRANGSGNVAGTRYYGGVAVRAVNVNSAGTPTGGTTLTWTITDHHGTGTIAVNSTTLSCDRRRSTPYGGPLGTQASGFGTKGFVGGTNDPTSLVHLGAREYDPSTGRFISVDPVFDRADSQSWNGYAYSNNAPVTSSDPAGTCYYDEDSQGCDHATNGPVHPTPPQPKGGPGKGKTKTKGNGGGNGGTGGSDPQCKTLTCVKGRLAENADTSSWIAYMLLPTRCVPDYMSGWSTCWSDWKIDSETVDEGSWTSLGTISKIQMGLDQVIHPGEYSQEITFESATTASIELTGTLTANLGGEIGGVDVGISTQISVTSSVSTTNSTGFNSGQTLRNTTGHDMNNRMSPQMQMRWDTVRVTLRNSQTGEVKSVVSYKLHLDTYAVNAHLVSSELLPDRNPGLATIFN